MYRVNTNLENGKLENEQVFIVPLYVPNDLIRTVIWDLTPGWGVGERRTI